MMILLSKMNYQNLVLFTAFLLPSSSGFNIKSKTYSFVELGTIPFVHSNHSGVSSQIQCATMCNGLNNSPCTGFQFTSSNCVLYTGTIWVSGNVDPSADIESMAYKVNESPRCVDHAGFSVVTKAQGQGYLCRHIPPEKEDYEHARQYCRSRGANLPVPGTELELTAINSLLRKKNNVSMFSDFSFWIGARWDSTTSKFRRDFDDGILEKYSALWAIGEPQTLGVKYCVAAGGPAYYYYYSVSCSMDFHFACEVLDFSENR